MNALGDYERKLDAARRWGKEWHFRIGVHLLRGITNPEQAANQYAELAQAMVQGLWPEVIKQFSGKYGIPPGRGAVVVVPPIVRREEPTGRQHCATAEDRECLSVLR